MTSTISLAPGLDMDASEAGTQTLGAIAAKGGGKSYLASKLAELLFDAGCPVIVIDPVGNWWALRLGADGKSRGLSITVVGGEHGDIPLDIGQGEALATFLVEHDGSAVIDVSHFSKTKRKSFVAEFCETLYHRSRLRRRPRMIIFEEAQSFAPQRMMRGDERMVGAVTDIVRLGRNYGLGSTLVTQRPESVSKEVLNQVECLFVGNLRGKHERKAIAEWVTEQAVDVKAQFAELPTLQPGEFFCWSPSWLKKFEKVRISEKRTFDGSKTPTLGKIDLQTKLGAIDVAALRLALVGPTEEEASMPKAKTTRTRNDGIIETTVFPPNHYGEDFTPADDVAVEESSLTEAYTEMDRLRQRIAELERQLGIERRRVAQGASLACWSNQVVDVLQRVGDGLAAAVMSYPTKDVESLLTAGLNSFEISSESKPFVAPRAPGSRMPPSNVSPPPQPSPPPSNGSGNYKGDLLATITTHGPVTRTQLSILSGKSKSSSTFAQAVSDLIKEELVVISDGSLSATSLGRKTAKTAPLPTGPALYAWWMNKLKPYDGRNFSALFAARHGLTRQELAIVTGHSKSSSTFAESVARLKTLGLCTQVGKKVVVTDGVRKAMQ